MAVASPINLTGVSSGLKSLQSGLNRVKDSTNNLKKVILNQTRVKREAIAGRRRLDSMREENISRKEREDILELSSIGGAVKRTGSIVAESTKGFLGRILDFASTLLVGWLLYNLPTILAMTRDLISRIKGLIGVLQGFMTNTTRIFFGFGELLSGVLYDVTHLDFLDSHNKVKGALNDLGLAFDDMHNQFEDGMKLLTTPLGEMPGEEVVPQTGTDFTQPTGAGSMVGGSNEQKTMSFLISQGLTPAQASGVAGNLKQESGFSPSADNGSHHGIAQWDKQDRWPKVSSYIRSIGKNPNSLEGQLYGLVWEAKSNGVWRMIQGTSTPQQSSKVWQDKFEIPEIPDSPAAQIEYRRRGKNAETLYSAYKNYNPQAAELTQAAATESPQPIGASGNVISVGKGILNQGFTVAENKYFTKFKGFNSKGNSPVGGHKSKDHATNALDVTDFRGSEASGIPRLKSLFLSLYASRQRYGIKALIFDPIGYWFTGMRDYKREAYGGHHNHLHVGFTKSADIALKSDKELGITNLSSPSPPSQPPAQIATQPQRNISVPTPERKGQQVVIIDDRQPQVQQGGGGYSPPQQPPIIIGNSVNSLIKRQMLLDLAYT